MELTDKERIYRLGQQLADYREAIRECFPEACVTAGPKEKWIDTLKRGAKELREHGTN